MLRVYKVFWPSNFKLKIAGEILELRDIIIDPPPKTEQTELMPIDKIKRSEYTGKRNLNLG